MRYQWLLLFIIMIFQQAQTAPQKADLKWDIPKGERLEITRTARVHYYLNGKKRRIYDERNIIDLTCYAKKDNKSKVKGVFSVFHREKGRDVFHLREKYKTDFSITERGKFNVGPKIYMPNLRDVPLFPDLPLKEGQKWHGRGSLVIADFSKPFKLMFDTNYLLKEIRSEDGKKTAVIHYQFTIQHDLRRGKYPKDFPKQIAAKNQGIILWNIDKNAPEKSKDTYRIVFVFHSGREFATAEFDMNIDTSYKMYHKVTKKDKEKEKEELKKELPDDVEVDTEKRGIVLRMGDILFDINSSTLRADSKKNLDAIAEVIRKKYPDREIIVEGHTDNTGTNPLNKRLSVDRARSAASYLKMKSGNDKTSYRGFGPDKPRADNSTTEGRRKNRRVEVIIKLH